MPQDQDGVGIAHVVILRRVDPSTDSACDALIERVKPMFRRMERADMLSSWWVGRADHGDTAASLALRLSHKARWVVCVRLQNAGQLAAYYDDPEHHEIREWFYRQLPSLASIWDEHDRSDASSRPELRSRLEAAATEEVLTRIDLNLFR